MCFVDVDPCEVWREVERKARKPHRCDCCLAAILPGQVYLSHFNIFEGRATSEKMCLPCRGDRQAFADDHDGTLFSPGYFFTVLGDCISDGDPDDRQWVTMRDRIKARRPAVPMPEVPEHG